MKGHPHQAVQASGDMGAKQTTSETQLVPARLLAGLFSHNSLTQLVWFLTFLGWAPVIVGINAHPILWLPFLGQANDHYLLAEQRAFFHPAIGIYTLATLAAASIAWKLKAPVFCWSVALLGVSCFLFLFNDNSADGFAYMPLFWLHSGLCTLTFLLFVRDGKVLSTSLLAFVWLLVIDAAISSYTEVRWLANFNANDDWPGVVPTLLGQVLSGYTPSLGKTAVFTLCLMLARLMFMAWRDNHTLLRQLGGKLVWRVAKRTLALWWPVLAIFGAMTLLYGEAADRLERQLICELQPSYLSGVERACDPPAGVTLETALQASIDANYQLAEARLQSAIDNAVDQSQDAADNGPDAVVGRIEQETAGRLPGTRHKDCGWDPVVCPIGNGLRTMANNSYQTSRQGMLDDLDTELNGLADEFQDDVAGYESAAQALVESRIAQAQRATQTGNSGAFTVYRFASYLLLLYSGIILLKTFLMVFARVLFEPGAAHSIPAHFADLVKRAKQGDIKVKKTEILVRKDVPEDRYYAYSSVQISGPKKARSFILGFRFVIARLLTRRFSFLHVPGKRTHRTDHSVKLNVEAPNQLIEWTLSPGERVFFRFGDLVGFSKPVTFGRLASLSITTIYFGRIFHYYAQGPGTLYFKSKAKPVTSAERSGQRPFDPSLLVAWNGSIGFFVDAKLDVLNTFLSSYNLYWAKSGHYLRDTSPTREGGATIGMLRFVRHFLLPI